MAANSPPNAPAFGAKLRELRIAAGLTQEEMAERTGLSARGISDLERGARKRPHFETVRLLADALELAPEARASLVAAARSPAGTVPSSVAPVIETIGGLPVPATRLIGRDREVEEAVHLLDHGEMRLLTLTGPGGVGKTRLAIEVVSRSVDAESAVFVDLAPIGEPDMVPTSVVRALGLRDPGNQDPEELLKATLKDQQMLLLLDNFEQVIRAGAFVGALLAACPKMKMLVTSRAPLRLKGEQEYPVPTLALPNPAKKPNAAELVEVPAVRLFVQRARSADPHFELDESNAQSVAEICQWLDGLPLAIELAAARVKLLRPDELLNLMKRRLSLLAGGPQDAPERQQAMRNTLDWSYDLLSPDAQTLFRRLSVFAGGCTLEAIEAVCADGLPDVIGQLSELADHSLVRRETQLDSIVRFRMLEVIREYGLRLLDKNGETDGIRQGHAAFFLHFSELADEALTGPEQGAWMTRLSAEDDNFQAVLGISIGEHNAETALKIGGNLWAYWDRRGQLWEARMWLERALGSVGDISFPLRIRALHRLGNLAIEVADLRRAQACFDEMSELCLENKDEAGFIISRHGLAVVAWYLGDYENAREMFEANRKEWQVNGERRREAIALHSLGDLSNSVGRFEDAREFLRAALAMQQSMGDMGGVAYSILSLAEADFYSGDLDAARTKVERCIQLFDKVGDRLGTAYARFNLGMIAMSAKDPEFAQDQFGEALARRREFGDRRGTIECIEGLAGVALAFGREEQAVRLLSSTAAGRKALGLPIPPVARPMVDSNLEALRSSLGASAFSAAWEFGQNLTIDESATFAASFDTSSIGLCAQNTVSASEIR